MTDQVQEGAPTTPEIVEPAVPQVSEVEQEVQQPSVPSEGITEARLQELLDSRLGSLTEELEKQAQSAKDRGISANAKQINDILSRLDELGGNRDALIQEVDQTTLLQKVAELEAQISNVPVPVGQAVGKTAWQSEWTGEAQKILDAAAKSGVELSQDEYNAAMFNNGMAFTAKGDAYVALNQAIISKAKGESISVAAIATEGGDVAKPPAPPAEPKTTAQRFEQAKAAGDQEAMQAVQDERWDAVEKQQKAQLARDTLEAAGISAEDLIEK